jgi:hypothetical protein
MGASQSTGGYLVPVTQLICGLLAGRWGTGLEPDEWVSVVNRRGAVAHSRRAGKGRRYTALVLLFLFPVVWVGLGAWLVAGGLGIRSHVEPVAGWPQTTGWVAALDAYQPSYANETYYRAVIAFRAAGHVVMFSAQVPGPLTVGAPARVTYDPHNPADAHDLSLGSYGEGQIYLGVGCLVSGVTVMGFFYWLVFLRQKSALRAAGVFSAQSEGRHVYGR